MNTILPAYNASVSDPAERIALAPRHPVPSGVLAETVIAVRHYTDRLFSFSTTRSQSFRFRSGEFAMIGLPKAEKPVFRAYSIASPAWADNLEFFSIKVENGPLTEHLQLIKPGDTILLRPKTTGTLVLDALRPGRRLWMLSTGTGIAPFASVMREPAAYETFERLVLTQTCRDVTELRYGAELAGALASDPVLAEMTSGRFEYYATTTRQPHERMGRITDLIWSGKLFRDLKTTPLDPKVDRVMICGSIAMTRDLKAILEARGFSEGSNADPGEFVLERAFVG